MTVLILGLAVPAKGQPAGTIRLEGVVRDSVEAAPILGAFVSERG